jgi:hypothetical protein
MIGALNYKLYPLSCGVTAEYRAGFSAPHAYLRASDRVVGNSRLPFAIFYRLDPLGIFAAGPISLA